MANKLLRPTRTLNWTEDGMRAYVQWDVHRRTSPTLFARIHHECPGDGTWWVYTNDYRSTSLATNNYVEARTIIEGLFALES